MGTETPPKKIHAFHGKESTFVDMPAAAPNPLYLGFRVLGFGFDSLRMMWSSGFTPGHARWWSIGPRRVWGRAISTSIANGSGYTPSRPTESAVHQSMRDPLFCC